MAIALAMSGPARAEDEKPEVRRPLVSPSQEQAAAEEGALKLSAKDRRHSLLSAGPGGPVFALLWLPLGGLAGLGFAEGINMRHSVRWAPVAIGALASLAAAGTLQYFKPLSVASAWLSLWGAVSGYLVGITVVLTLDGVPTSESAALWIVMGSALAGGWIVPALPAVDRITGPTALAIVLGTLMVEVFAFQISLLLPSRRQSGAYGVMLLAPPVLLGVGYLLGPRLDPDWSTPVLWLGLPALAGIIGTVMGDAASGKQAAAILGSLAVLATAGGVAIVTSLSSSERTLGKSGAPIRPVIVPAALPLETGRGFRVVPGMALAAAF